MGVQRRGVAESRGGMKDLAREASAQADQAVGARKPLVPGSLQACETGVCVPPDSVLGEERVVAGEIPL